MKQLNIGKLATGSVLSLGEIAANGFRAEPDLDVKHITEVILRGKQENAKLKENAYQSGKKFFAASQKSLNEAFDDALTFAQLTRDNLKPEFGSQYSQAWNEVGFVNGTLRMPRTVLKAMALVSAMQLFLLDHPELIVPNTVTPELAAETYDTLKAACTAAAQAKMAMRQKKTERDEAIGDLRRTLMLLRRELSMLLADEDPRWLSFGFHVPGDISVPQAPEGLAVTSDAPGQARLSWGKPANTDRFHLWQQTVGIDAAPVRVATVSEPSKTLTGLTAGAQMRFSITALNAAGESVPSETVEVVVAESDSTTPNPQGFGTPSSTDQPSMT